VGKGKTGMGKETKEERKVGKGKTGMEKEKKEERKVGKGRQIQFFLDIYTQLQVYRSLCLYV